MGKTCKRRSRKGFEMKKVILYFIIALVIGTLFAGCGSSSGPIYPMMSTYDADNKENAFGSFAFGQLFMKPEYNKDAPTALECTRNAFLYVAARESLKRGYPYFVIADNNSNLSGMDNNLLGIPTVNYQAWSNYCNPEYRFKKTGLENFKCQFRKPFKDIPNRIDSYVVMYKQKNYLFPTWDAKKTMQEAKVKANECIDFSKYGPEVKSVDSIRMIINGKYPALDSNGSIVDK